MSASGKGGQKREETRYLQPSEKGAWWKTTEKGSEIDGMETTEKGSESVAWRNRQPGARSAHGAEQQNVAERRNGAEQGNRWHGAEWRNRGINHTERNDSTDESTTWQGGFCHRAELRCQHKEGDLGEMMIWEED